MNWMDWKWQLNHTITGIEELPPEFTLSEKEKLYFQDQDIYNFSFAVTPYYFSLIKTEDPADPVRRQVIPDLRELEIKPYELNDPLGENQDTVLPRLIHKYKDRVLLHATSRCAVHCRHCFRRGFIREMDPVISRDELAAVCRYIKTHPDIEEILISGGDPLVFDDHRLEEILESLKCANKQLTIRIGTRMPVVLPQRITDSLVQLLKAFKPLWIATHFNTPAEITDQSLLALSRLVNAGIPVVNQTVLLRGINDNLMALKTLFRSLVKAGVKPYYLLQGDLAPGTSHFRTPLGSGIQLYRKLMADLSGLALPKLAVDAPGGGGKIPLTTALLVENGYYKLEAPGNGVYWYPVEN